MVVKNGKILIQYFSWRLLRNHAQFAPTGTGFQSYNYRPALRHFTEKQFSQLAVNIKPYKPLLLIKITNAVLFFE